MAMDSEVDIAAVLLRVAELHSALSSAIERCLRSSLPSHLQDRPTFGYGHGEVLGMLEGQSGGPGGEGAAAARGADKGRQSEVRALLDARDALEELEAQLELYQMCPAAHRDLALRSLEEKRRKLALCLYRHGAVAGARMDIDPQERQVVLDLMAFIGEEACEAALEGEGGDTLSSAMGSAIGEDEMGRMPLPLPPYSGPIVRGALLPPDAEELLDPGHPHALSFQEHHQQQQHLKQQQLHMHMMHAQGQGQGQGGLEYQQQQQAGRQRERERERRKALHQLSSEASLLPGRAAPHPRPAHQLLPDFPGSPLDIFKTPGGAPGVYQGHDQEVQSALQPGLRRGHQAQVQALQSGSSSLAHSFEHSSTSSVLQAMSLEHVDEVAPGAPWAVAPQGQPAAPAKPRGAAAAAAAAAAGGAPGARQAARAGGPEGVPGAEEGGPSSAESSSLASVSPSAPREKRQTGGGAQGGEKEGKRKDGRGRAAARKARGAGHVDASQGSSCSVAATEGEGSLRDCAESRPGALRQRGRNQGGVAAAASLAPQRRTPRLGLRLLCLPLTAAKGVGGLGLALVSRSTKLVLGSALRAGGGVLGLGLRCTLSLLRPAPLVGCAVLLGAAHAANVTPPYLEDAVPLAAAALNSLRLAACSQVEAAREKMGKKRRGKGAAGAPTREASVPLLPGSSRGPSVTAAVIRSTTGSRTSGSGSKAPTQPEARAQAQARGGSGAPAPSPSPAPLPGSGPGPAGAGAAPRFARGAAASEFPELPKASPRPAAPGTPPPAAPKPKAPVTPAPSPAPKTPLPSPGLTPPVGSPATRGPGGSGPQGPVGGEPKAQSGGGGGGKGSSSISEMASEFPSAMLEKRGGGAAGPRASPPKPSRDGRQAAGFAYVLLQPVVLDRPDVFSGRG